ncbi:MAG: hypothetical protein KIT10_01350 [Flavobacteriales bacterium]|nr:hypothetical protein [Flavobacteriales bacterium]
MKRLLTSCIILGVAIATVRTLHGQSSFTQLLGGMYAQDGVGVMPTATGWMVAARIYDPGARRYRPFLMHCGSNGQLNGQAELPLNGAVFLQAMAMGTGDDRFIAGSSFAPGRTDHDGVLIKLDAQANVLWAVRPDLPGQQQYLGVASLPDGGAVVCGVSVTGATHDVLVARFDAQGGVLWTQVFPSIFDEEANGVAVDATGLVIAGRRMNAGGASDAMAMRLDLQGALQWDNSTGSALNETAKAVVRAPDGRFILAGHTDGLGPQDHLGRRKRCVHLIKLDHNGDTLWTRVHGDTIFNRAAHAIALASNGDLIIGGERYRSAIGDAMAMRCGTNGQLSWERAYETGKEAKLLHVHALAQGFVASGWSFAELGRQVLLLRRNDQGD